MNEGKLTPEEQAKLQEVANKVGEDLLMNGIGGDPTQEPSGIIPMSEETIDAMIKKRLMEGHEKRTKNLTPTISCWRCRQMVITARCTGLGLLCETCFQMMRTGR